MTVENGNTVTVHYRGTLDDGTEFDNSRNRGEPITFEVGSGQMITGFDSAITGMTVGEVKEIMIEPEDAYGTHNESAIQELPLTMFPSDFDFVAGNSVQGQQPNGQPFLAKIMSTTESTVTLDFNHPLAGKQLTFAIELVNIL